MVGPDVERYSWAEGMSGQYMVNIILRLTAKSGLQGISGAAMINAHGFDRSVGETLALSASRHDRPIACRARRCCGTAIAISARRRCRRRNRSSISRLWDMTARYAKLPLYQLLGGARHKILSYASTPLLDDNQAYIDYIAERQAEGFKAVKFHCWCNPARDLPLCEASAKHFAGTGMSLMLDVEQRYDLASALKVGRRLANSTSNGSRHPWSIPMSRAIAN